MRSLFFLLFLFAATNLFAQQNPAPPYIHSHNDYLQEIPLLGALNAGAKSIEIDIFLQNDSLFVAHSKREIQNKNTLKNLYILPLKTYLSENKTRHDFHLMIDIKSEPVSTLGAIQKTLKKYPHIFSKDGIQVIISGNRPKAESYSSYVEFIWFDARSPAEINGIGGDKIKMISQNLSRFTKWRGEGTIPAKEKTELLEFINQSHKTNRPIRLWNSGDNKKMYKFLCSIGVDYINTDNPKSLREFIDSRADNKNQTKK